ncbi:MAG TPA: DUF881 domain-containing protein [Nocardioidaceae bacterium]|nr:DUF881 domain-containing protein [Nocardioidaceae bacterium]
MADRRPRGSRAPLPWRLLVPAVFLVAGGLFVTSAVSSGGTDLRAGRYDDLDGLANAQRNDLQQLRDKAATLTDQVNKLSAGLGKGVSAKVEKRAQALRGPAGLTPVHGPAVTITLDDAPKNVQQASDVDVSQLLVHQQDIQAVVNALWAGGAEAMTIQGQRVVATTGIKCVGNTVVLHDVPYSPPYVISAIGDTEQMLERVDTDPYIAIYLEYVQSQKYQLGWDVQTQPDLRMPGYDGSTELSYARPAGGAPGGSPQSDK